MASTCAEAHVAVYWCLVWVAEHLHPNQQCSGLLWERSVRSIDYRVSIFSHLPVLTLVPFSNCQPALKL